MMKRPDRIAAFFGAAVLASVVIVSAFSVSAEGGDKKDPLITLSYLTQVVTPQLEEMVDKQVEANEEALNEKLNDAIDDYVEQMEDVLAESAGESSSYTFVTLAAGETMVPEAGSELLLRSGSVSVSSGSSPALIDATAGSNLEVGGGMKSNHLYVAPLEGATVTASVESVVMVRGAYTIV